MFLHRIILIHRGGVIMENFDLSAITGIFEEISKVLGDVDLTKVIQTLKDIFGKIVEFVSGLIAK